MLCFLIVSLIYGEKIINSENLFLSFFLSFAFLSVDFFTVVKTATYAAEVELPNGIGNNLL